tara:strand:- start:93 stop:338 length:246 start_codon:yes stop_codon:yes gene_type:complete
VEKKRVNGGMNIEKKFVLDVKYACQEILNRYYSIQVAQKKLPEDPWWIHKINSIEQNCDSFLDGDIEIQWHRDFSDKAGVK